MVNRYKWYVEEIVKWFDLNIEGRGGGISLGL
jgi:hypothetical protein